MLLFLKGYSHRVTVREATGCGSGHLRTREALFPEYGLWLNCASSSRVSAGCYHWSAVSNNTVKSTGGFHCVIQANVKQSHKQTEGKRNRLIETGWGVTTVGSWEMRPVKTVTQIWSWVVFHKLWVVVLFFFQLKKKIW